MSRPIEFRAWFKPTQENKKWFADRYYKHCRYYTTEDFLDDTWVNTEGYEEPIIFEQYTGLKDKNSKEIYEGDIVKGDMGVFEVKWYDFVAKFMFTPNIDMEWYPSFVSDQVNKMEVIGNIHENPELLGGEDV